jgi:hypothetical protein
MFTIILHQYFFDLEEIIFENFNISENNRISVELAQGTTKVFPPSLCMVLLRRECPPHSPKHLLWLIHLLWVVHL